MAMESDEMSDTEDELTQPLNSQNIFTATPNDDRVWGRLRASRNLPNLDLRKDRYLFGRGDKCDYQFSRSQFSGKYWCMLSKHHFRIERQLVDRYSLLDENCEPETAAYIEDISRNGVYVNSECLNHSRRRLLNNDVIKLLTKDDSPASFIFENLSRYHESILSRYTIDKIIGTGNFSEVCLIFSRKTMEKFALKCIKQSMSGKSLTKKSFTKWVNNEIIILKKLSHINVIKMYEILHKNNEVFIVLEFMEGGELSQRIKENIHLSEYLTKFYFFQIFSAVEYLHSNNIVHRDLKPENILLAKMVPETLVKVTDFGLSTIANDKPFMTTYCGTPFYQAPEIKFGERSNLVYHNSVDIWSLGAILYQCVSGNIPFLDANGVPDEQETRAENLPFSVSYLRSLTPECKQLIREMLRWDERQRPNSHTLLHHVWFTSDEPLVTKVSQLQSSNCSSNSSSVTSDENLTPDTPGLYVSQLPSPLSPTAKRLKLCD